jgi:hypothetical protein
MVSFQMPYLTSRRQKCNRLTHHTQRCDHKNTIFIAIDLNVWVKNKKYQLLAFLQSEVFFLISLYVHFDTI